MYWLVLGIGALFIGIACGALLEQPWAIITSVILGGLWGLLVMSTFYSV